MTVGNRIDCIVLTGAMEFDWWEREFLGNVCVLDLSGILQLDRGDECICNTSLTVYTWLG